MTNHWLDLQNAKVFLIQGSNAAENHVMSMKWVRKAQERGAIIIHVDPRYNRTSAAADIYARIRAGSDIAFLNAIINYILVNDLYDEAYVKTHTNALMLTNQEFGFEDGLFSGFDQAGHKYDMGTWNYDLDPATKKPRKAASLDDPNCAFAKLRTFFGRYTLDAAEAVSGVPAATIKKIADTLVANRPGTIMYALGMTQHTVAVQNIRSYGILQLLLGNIGKPGGGVNALRGEPNVQGACDMGVLNNYMPGYLNHPSSNEPTFKDWTKNNGTFRAKFLVNSLKAWFGENATAANDFGYEWLPKRGNKDYSVLGLIDAAARNELKMLYVVGQNPIVTNPNLNHTWQAFDNLETLVVQDLWETETAAFWHRPGVDPKDIKTEVILLPAAYFMEKEGTITGSGRLVQWRYKAVEPPGSAKSDLEIFDGVYRRLRTLYADSKDPKDQIFKTAVWNYPQSGMAEAVLQEIGGFDLKSGKPVNGIGDLQADGTTSSGSWIYAGVFKGGNNLTKRRDSKTDPSGLGIYPNFAWTWPGNMHILYNRASCDENGVPYDKDKAIVWWDAEQQKWTGIDTPDVPVATDGPSTPNGQRAFRMNGEGVGRLFAATYKDPDPKNPELPRDSSYTPKDGPLPEFYEPVESPTANSISVIQNNPILKYPRIKGRQPIGKASEFPYVLMTSSMTEHWCGGSTTRNVPLLNELVPEPVVELPEKLAKQLGIATGDWTRVSSARGEVEVKAVVTKRMQPSIINGREVFTVWMPYNWGFKGLSTGPSTNVLTIDAVDPNAGTQETKACLVNVVRADAKGGARV